MRICLRDIYRKISKIFYAVIAICSKSHKRSTAALDFHHIAYSLFVKLLLSKYADYGDALLDKADRTVLELTSCVCFGMYIAYLFHFKASLKSDSIINASADKECILCACQLVCIPLDTFLVFKNLFDLVRDSIEFFKKLSALILGHFAACNSKLQSKKISCNKLCAVCLCCSNGYFGTCKCIEYIISLTSYR